jgi:hypothetical protein
MAGLVRLRHPRAGVAVTVGGPRTRPREPSDVEGLAVLLVARCPMPYTAAMNRPATVRIQGASSARPPRGDVAR